MNRTLDGATDSHPGADCAAMTEPRRYALGVDTGGTYTDAVVYDERAREIVAKAKSPTTHDDLAIGIGMAIDAALADAAVDSESIEMVALSTTLATNALVEGTGRPACLVTIGFEADALDRGGPSRTRSCGIGVAPRPRTRRAAPPDHRRRRSPPSPAVRCGVDSP